MSSLVLAATESVALAALCDGLTPPEECSVGRNVNGYHAGVATGERLTLQIWKSTAVAENVDNWAILKEQITTTIPKLVSSALGASPSDYTTCRMQGLLEGTVCQMDSIATATTSTTATGVSVASSPYSSHFARITECLLDGADWGKIASGIYCALSTELGGLADVKPWFIRYPLGLCAASFQLFCEDTYRYGATYGNDPLSPIVKWFVQSQGQPVESFLQTPECVKYTNAPYVQVFSDSVYIDCSYVVPAN